MLGLRPRISSFGGSQRRSKGTARCQLLSGQRPRHGSSHRDVGREQFSDPLERHMFDPFDNKALKVRGGDVATAFLSAPWSDF